MKTLKIFLLFSITFIITNKYFKTNCMNYNFLKTSKINQKNKELEIFKSSLFSAVTNNNIQALNKCLNDLTTKKLSNNFNSLNNLNKINNNKNTNNFNKLNNSDNANNSKNLNIDILNNSGQTALYLACKLGYDSIAKKLIDSGADVNFTMGGANPLYFAYTSQNLELSKILILKGALEIKGARTNFKNLEKHYEKAKKFDQEFNNLLTQNPKTKNLNK